MLHKASKWKIQIYEENQNSAATKIKDYYYDVFQYKFRILKHIGIRFIKYLKNEKKKGKKKDKNNSKFENKMGEN